MKLNCIVEVHNRLLSGTNIAHRRKPQRSCLAIGRNSVKTDELFLLLQSQQNKQGTKYKINGNINNIFVKFINEGKATIRLTQPPHDLIIQCSAIELKSFIHVLKLGLSKKADPSVLPISNLKPKSLPVVQKSKIVIKKNSDYPTLQGFPRTTTELSLTGLGRKSFDRQILKLQSLRVLDLSENQISSLPKELGSLPHLQELILSQNNLGKAALSKWTWMDQPAISRSLRLLDISCNLLNELPEQIGKLAMLVNLKLNQNMLTSLPQSIGNLTDLKYLELSKNSICHLPGSMRNLKLFMIDVSENPFPQTEPYSECRMSVPRLVECAAKTFLKTRFPYNASLIPSTLVVYLDAAKYCVCGSACFDTFIRKFLRYDLSRISNSVKSSGAISVPFDCYFCKMACLRRYIRI